MNVALVRDFDGQLYNTAFIEVQTTHIVIDDFAGADVVDDVLRLNDIGSFPKGACAWPSARPERPDRAAAAAAAALSAPLARGAPSIDV